MNRQKFIYTWKLVNIIKTSDGEWSEIIKAIYIYSSRFYDTERKLFVAVLGIEKIPDCIFFVLMNSV